jgi:hypothetical protein
MSVDFIGVGWSFPLRIDPNKNTVVTSENDDRIYESIRIIIETDQDERPFCMKNGVKFGTRVKRALFENVETAIDIAKYDVKRALDVWEPRIYVTSVNAYKTMIGNLAGIAIDISWRYRSTNRADNKVFPFSSPNGGLE